MADNVSLKIWDSIRPLVRREIRQNASGCTRMKNMMISTAYNAQTGVVGVREPFGKEILLPVRDTVDKALLTVGTPVWVLMPDGDASNAVVSMLGNGNCGEPSVDLEGVVRYDEAQTLSETQMAQARTNIDALDAYQGKVLLDMVAARNLLDNSDFTNPVNQRGGTSGAVTAWTYFIDRWQATDAALTYSIGADGLHLTAGDAWMAQNVQSSETKVGTTYTLVVGFSDGTFTLCTGALPAGETSWTEFANNNDDNCYVRMAKITGAVIICSFKPKKAVVVTWAALYEGAYTADTLPPYVPKGYAAELAECQRYFVAVSYNNTMLSGNTGDASGVGARIYLPLGTRMRINPTVSAFVVNAFYYGGAKNNLTFTPSNVETTYTGLCFYGNLSSAVSASPTYVNAVYQIRNADLAISADL